MTQVLQKPVFALPGCQRTSVNTLLCDTLALAEFCGCCADLRYRAFALFHVCVLPIAFRTTAFGTSEWFLQGKHPEFRQVPHLCKWARESVIFWIGLPGRVLTQCSVIHEKQMYLVPARLALPTKMIT